MQSTLISPKIKHRQIIKVRYYADDRAEKLYNKILANGAMTVKDISGIFDKI